MLSEKEILYCIKKRKIEEARSNILRGNDIESACLIIKEALYNSVIMVDDEINITKIAIRQALDFIEEYKNKGYLDVVREKVQLKERNKELEQENNKQNKIIDEMADMISSLDLTINRVAFGGKTRFESNEEIKQYFEKKVEDEKCVNIVKK